MAGLLGKTKEFFRSTMLGGGAQPPQHDFIDEDYDYDYEDDRRKSSRSRQDSRAGFDGYDDYHDDAGYKYAPKSDFRSGIDQAREPRTEPRFDSRFDSRYDDRVSSYSSTPKAAPRSHSSKSFRTEERRGLDPSYKSEYVIAKPSSISEAVSLCEYIDLGRLVIVDLSRADDESCQRIADYLSGACQMARGEIRRINNGIFAIAPKNFSGTIDYYEETETADIGFTSARSR
jgi:FtsZ-interacting cell division protein YlmF